MENSLAKYIWRHTGRQQIWVLTIVLLSMIPYFLSFDLPKQIVNGPIQGAGFKTPDATQLFLHISFSLPLIGKIEVFPGIELTRMATLFALSVVFLLLVVVNGLFKFYINTYKGRLGERLLRRIRFDLVDRILRFPPATFKRLKAAEISSMVKDEVEPLGGFTGDAFVSPMLLGGQALTALTFIVTQNLWLGLITLFLVAVQGLLIPRLRRRLLILGRERQLTAREFAGRVGEIVEGIGAIHAYDTTNLERADIGARLAHIFKIRYDIYQWKFMVKFINNFLASVTPFLFYSVGGYLTLKGQLDIGQLVAVIGAYKDLPGPLKDLIDWDQARQDVQVKYQQVVGQFSISPMIEPDLHLVTVDDMSQTLKSPLAAVNLTLLDDSGAVILDKVNFKVGLGESVAVLGKGTAEGEALAEALARLTWAASGRVTAGDQDILTLPEAVTGRAISYAGPDPYFFFGTLRDNLLYSLKHAPLRETDLDEEAGRLRLWEQVEAKRAGIPYFDMSYDWIDYLAAGANGPDDLHAAVFPVLEAVELTQDILDLALRSCIEGEGVGDLPGRLVELRGELYAALDDKGLKGVIVPFEPNAYNVELTVGENLLFGNPIGSTLAGMEIRKNPYFREVIVETGLHHSLFNMGVEIAENTIDLFGDLASDHPFFQQLTFMTAEEIPHYEMVIKRLDGRGFDAATPDERAGIIGLGFAYVEPRHRFGLLTEELMARIVDFRKRFRDGLPADLSGAIEFYDPDSYTRSGSVLDNVLFGRISQKQADGRKRVYELVTELLISSGLYDRVLSLGLDFHVGAGGRRLTSVQRQKIGLARGLLRRSTYFVFNRPLTALDNRLQTQIVGKVLAHLRQGGRNPGVVWVLTNAALSDLFDRVVVFDNGEVVEDGTHLGLSENSKIFKELRSA